MKQEEEGFAAGAQAGLVVLYKVSDAIRPLQGGGAAKIGRSVRI